MIEDLNQQLFKDWNETAELIHNSNFHELDNNKVSRDDLFHVTISISHSLDDSIANKRNVGLLQYYLESASEYFAKKKEHLDIKTFIIVWQIFAKESSNFMKRQRTTSDKPDYLK